MDLHRLVRWRASPSDVLWLVDGIRINNRLYGGTTPLDTLPASMVERIEVLNGGQALFYGTRAPSSRRAASRLSLQRHSLMAPLRWLGVRVVDVIVGGQRAAIDESWRDPGQRLRGCRIGAVSGHGAFYRAGLRRSRASCLSICCLHRRRFFAAAAGIGTVRWCSIFAIEPTANENAAQCVKFRRKCATQKRAINVFRACSVQVSIQQTLFEVLRGEQAPNISQPIGSTHHEEPF